MLTKACENAVGVDTHTQVISRNELDKAFCAQKPNVIFNNIKLVM